MAINLMALTPVGFALGPVAVPLLARLWPSDPLALGRGLACLGILVGPLAVVLFFVSLRNLTTLTPADSQSQS